MVLLSKDKQEMLSLKMTAHPTYGIGLPLCMKHKIFMCIKSKDLV